MVNRYSFPILVEVPCAVLTLLFERFHTRDTPTSRDSCIYFTFIISWRLLGAELGDLWHQVPAKVTPDFRQPHQKL